MKPDPSEQTVHKFLVSMNFILFERSPRKLHLKKIFSYKIDLEEQSGPSKLDHGGKCVWWWAVIQLFILSLKPVPSVFSLFVDTVHSHQ